MLKGEQVWLTNDYSSVNWPMPMSDAVKDLALRLGVEVDDRTKIRSDYSVEYPGDYTIREVLSYISAAHGGNWIITDAGKLRLVTLMEIPAETNYLIEEYGNAVTFGGVRILV